MPSPALSVEIRGRLAEYVYLLVHYFASILEEGGLILTNSVLDKLRIVILRTYKT